MKYQHSSFTDQGPYSENQDSLQFSLTHDDLCLACIADGVGSENCGQQAAQFATQFFIEALERNPSSELWEVANAVNADLLSRPEQGFVTTFTGVVIKGYELLGIHSGDTRVCLLRGDGIKQLTEDHTEYLRLIKAGKLTPEEAVAYPRKHVLESALGTMAEPQLDCFGFELQKGDRVLLMTDGVHNLVSKRELRDISKANQNVQDFVSNVVERIKEKTPSDNYSLIIIEVTQ